MFDTFNTLFDTLRSLLTSNEPINAEKIQTITSNKSNLLNIISNPVNNLLSQLISFFFIPSHKMLLNVIFSPVLISMVFNLIR
jgi:hypothetical protein